MLGSEKKKCPVCDSEKVTTSKPAFFTKIKETFWPFKGESKNLNLCSDCSFSWED
jgi:hypothetical protein